MKIAETITTSPRADIYSYKSLGYSFKTAVADLIDNSISAKSTNIKIITDFKSSKPKLWIVDDGEGMDLEDLITAMKPGGKDPTIEREDSDLGRFGLGLKSASFSQCNKLKVVTRKKKSIIYSRTWDLEHVIKSDKWELFEEDITKYEKDLLDDNGTIVCWENFSNLNENNKSSLSVLLKDSLEYCRLVFHKFLSQKKIAIFFNDLIIEPLDPFLSENKNVMRLPIENRTFGKIQGHILPIPNSKIPKIENDNYDLLEGFSKSQGVYVYREDRLIAFGGWFGIIKENELSKLARVSIEYNNKLDSIWSLNVIKSSAIPPKGSRPFFKRVFEDSISKSKSSFKEKSTRLTDTNPFLKNKPDEIWRFKKDRETDNCIFQINTENDFLRFYCENNNMDFKKISPLLKIISDLLPYESILEQYSDNPKSLIRDNFNENNEMIIHGKNFLNHLINTGKTKAEALRLMSKTSPFKEYKEILAAL